MSLDEPSAQAQQVLTSLLEQIHITLKDNLRQQNDRISRLEAGNSPAPRSVDGELEEAHPEALDALSNDILPTNPPTGRPQFDANDFGMVMSVWPDPNEAILIKAAAPISWHTTSVTQYMEVSPLPFTSTHKGGLLVHYPEWCHWFRSQFWIPADRRMPLAFDIDHLNQCASINQAVSRYKALHDFNERLCYNSGRLLIIDNNTLGENRVSGNLVEKSGWRRGFLSNKYSMLCDNDGNRLDRAIDEHGLKEIPAMTWTTIDGTIAGNRPVAPWRRLIIIEGLVGIRPKEHKEPRFDYNLSTFWAHGYSIMPGYGFGIKKFLTASTQAFSSREGYSFQYAWFFSITQEQIQRWSPEGSREFETSLSSQDPESWDPSWIRLLRVGKLYGSSNSMIARDAYCFKMVYTDNKEGDTGDDMNNYWSAVVLRRPSWRSNTNMLPMWHAQLQILSNSNEALTSIIDDSTEIVDHIGRLLDIGDEVILDPDRHDELLFDDEAFSRSRTYWWTLNMLTAMRQSLAETQAVHQEMWDTVIEPLMPMDDWPIGAPEIVREDKTLAKELTKLQDRIIQQHQRAEALRSGLFNASGVVESRASTRLGEIVKLLTYVSIFYLPLTFSTSLWSTTDQIRALSTAVMFGVMIALGVFTYAVTFNLNNLTRALYRQYEAAKKPWIRKMKQESGGQWHIRAEQYSGFKIKRFDNSLSEWLIIWYMITWPLRRCFRSRISPNAENQDVPQQATQMPNKGKKMNDHTETWLRNHPPFPDIEDAPAKELLRSSSSYAIPPNAETSRSSTLSKLFSISRTRKKHVATPGITTQSELKVNV